MPRWFRDFHDQKDVFKACERMLGRPKSVSGNDDGISWVDGHVFTVDRFLRFMAMHGYTLRRTRADSLDLKETLERFRAEQIEAMRMMMRNREESP